MLVCPGQRVLRRHELEAFLAAAVSPLLHDVEMMQEMKVGDTHVIAAWTELTVAGV